MNKFQDELKRLEQESDRTAAREAADQAAAVRKMDRAVAAAEALGQIIEKCVNEAQAVSSIAVKRPTANAGTAIWVLAWKDASRGIEIEVAKPDGRLCWRWQAEGPSPLKSRPATDIDEAFIQRLIINLADQSAWRTGGFPNI